MRCVKTSPWHLFMQVMLDLFAFTPFLPPSNAYRCILGLFNLYLLFQIGKLVVEELTYLYILKENPKVQKFFFMSKRAVKDLRELTHIKDNVVWSEDQIFIFSTLQGWKVLDVGQEIWWYFTFPLNSFMLFDDDLVSSLAIKRLKPTW